MQSTCGQPIRADLLQHEMYKQWYRLIERLLKGSYLEVSLGTSGDAWGLRMMCFISRPVDMHTALIETACRHMLHGQMTSRSIWKFCADRRVEAPVRLLPTASAAANSCALMTSSSSLFTFFTCCQHNWAAFG